MAAPQEMLEQAARDRSHGANHVLLVGHNPELQSSRSISSARAAKHLKDRL